MRWLALVVSGMLAATACGGGGGNDPVTAADVAGEEIAGVPDVPAAGDDAAPDPGDDPAPVEVVDDPGVDDPGDPGAGDTAASDPAGEEVVSAQCAALKSGMNTGFMVDGLARSFILTLPKTIADKQGWPIIFNWHGFGDTADNMASLFSGAVNDSEMPFILVTPEVDGQEAFDWDMTTVYASTPDKDVRLFDEVLACLDAQYGVDPDRVFSVGFSAGGLMTDLIGNMRGEKVASLVSYSGGYFSDKINLQGIAFNIQWPDPGPSSGYAQVILYGGAKDVYDAVVAQVPFNQFAINDTTFLNGLGHDVIRCNHDSGHTVPYGFQSKQVLEFFKKHTRGVVDSPFAAGLPADYPKYCDFHAKTTK